ncbi:asparaginase [Panaeolus papilionaceus]|nr:asparaginase [Panaeolus papilionaceus]
MEKTPLLNVSSEGHYVLVIHGGAGTMSKEGSTPAQQAEYKAALSRSLLSGYDVLSHGGEAMDAVVAAVKVMEDCPLFNSAHGAVFNVAGKNELETSLMLSKPPKSAPHVPSTRRGLGLTLLTRAKNPSSLVRALYLQPTLAPHTFLSGATAENIGASLGETLVDSKYFFTERRWREHRRGLGLPEEPLPQETTAVDEPKSPTLDELPTGTVGAVALDVNGCIAVLTSTGGKTNKLVGRVGDTPVMGSGFWVEKWSEAGWVTRIVNSLSGRSNKKAVGISGTGDGDYFIRYATASTIARRVQYLGESLQQAASQAVQELYEGGGLGGVIALDRDGNVAMPLNCSGMYRGVIREDGVPKTAIFSDDVLS